MKGRLPVPIVFWLLLVAMALAAYQGGRTRWVALAWLLAAGKGILVSEGLMELHRAPWPWRVALAGWVLGSVAGILLLLS